MPYSCLEGSFLASSDTTATCCSLNFEAFHFASLAEGACFRSAKAHLQLVTLTLCEIEDLTVNLTLILTLSDLAFRERPSGTTDISEGAAGPPTIPKLLRTAVASPLKESASSPPDTIH